LPKTVVTAIDPCCTLVKEVNAVRTTKTIKKIRKGVAMVLILF
jgi:hypothetical protein